MNTGWGLQSPGETRLWEMDWTQQLEADETVETSNWVIRPDPGEVTGPALGDGVIDTAGKETQVTVAGLSSGLSYQLRNIVTTSRAQILVREITIRCGYRQ